jgi:beta-glucosidase
MLMKRTTLVSFFIFLIQFSISVNGQRIVYKDSTVSTEKRVKDLLSRMTLEEKILQLNQTVTGLNINLNNIGQIVDNIPTGIGSIIYQNTDPVIRNQIQKKTMDKSRLGIPILFGFDVIHGLRTVYPISLAQACSWNPELVTQACEVAAKESKLSGIDWTFSPMIDVARDGRWGRVAEGYGEDPYVNAVFGVASVKGYQGEDLNDQYSIAACLKHYVGYGESEGGRDYHYSDISMQSLWETYLVPYEACVKAGAATIMSAFNDISGIPATANYYALTEILKNRWRHDGFVVSDWNAIEQLIDQGYATDRKDAGYKSFMAGVEMDMKDNIYFEYLPLLIGEKKIPMKKIDDAVGRILKVKFKLGLFDHPYVNVIDETSRYLQPESKTIAQKLAAETMVLLKNNNKILPISPSIKQIAIIGPMAKNRANLIGAWATLSKENDVESLYEGLENEFKNKIILNYAKGCDFDGNDESGFAEAIEMAQKSEIILVCLGEKKYWSGENASRSSIALPAIQEKLVQALKKTGKPIVLVLVNGRPLELIRLEPLADAILEIWQPGIAGGSAFSGILSGKINPSGKLAITFPLTTGQIPIYYNMRQSARPTQGKYQDISTTPLYWFGHGLSYTTFSYGEVKLSSNKIRKSDKLIAEVEISNNGSLDGMETALWYISDPSASITRPMKELKYFEKKELKAGDKSLFRFEINPIRDLSFPDANGERHLESGDFYLMIDNQKVKFELMD